MDTWVYTQPPTPSRGNHGPDSLHAPGDGGEIVQVRPPSSRRSAGVYSNLELRSVQGETQRTVADAAEQIRDEGGVVPVIEAAPEPAKPRRKSLSEHLWGDVQAKVDSNRRPSVPRLPASAVDVGGNGGALEAEPHQPRRESFQGSVQGGAPRPVYVPLL